MVRYFPETTTDNARVLEHVGRLETTNHKEHLMGTTLFARIASFEAAPRRRRPEMEEGRYVIDPVTARRILDEFNYANQRRVSPLHVAKLASEMKAGSWTPGSQIAFGVMPDKSTHFVNGQHRLHSVIESGKEIEFQVLLVPCASQAALHALYYRFDAVQKTRSDQMIIRSTGLAESLDLPSSVVTAAYKAAPILANGLVFLPPDKIDPALGTPDGKLDAMEGWWEHVQTYRHLIDKAPAKVKQRLLNSSVMAVALATIRHQPARASEFWRGVALDDGLKVGDARKALLRYLTENSLKNGWNDTLICVSHCWDAWYRGASLRFVRSVSGSSCKPAGTPYANMKTKAA